MRWAIVACVLMASCAQTEKIEPLAATEPAPLEEPASAYALLDQPIPYFTATDAGGSTVSEASLADQWTVLGFCAPSVAACAAEAVYSEALGRAIAQDPGLKFAMIDLDANVGARDAFQVDAAPFYLVIGPDRTVRGYRGALSAELKSDGGVKTFLQDVSEMKKRP